MPSSAWSPMRDTRDRWRCRPAGPCRYRPRPPAMPPPGRRAVQRWRTLRQQRSNTTIACNVTGEEGALSDSGPLLPAFEYYVLSSAVPLSCFSGTVVTAVKIYSALPVQNRRRAILLVDEIG